MIFFIIFTYPLTILLYLHNNILITNVLKTLCNLKSKYVYFGLKMVGNIV